MKKKLEHYFVEPVGNFYQSVFPHEQSELGQMHTTVKDAKAYILEVAPKAKVKVLRKTR